MLLNSLSEVLCDFATEIYEQYQAEAYGLRRCISAEDELKILDLRAQIYLLENCIEEPNLKN